MKDGNQGYGKPTAINFAPWCGERLNFIYLTGHVRLHGDRLLPQVTGEAVEKVLLAGQAHG